MEHLFQGKTLLDKLKQWVLYGFIAFIIAITIAVFSIITYTNDSAKNNDRRVFESSLWNALQLQVQSYRFFNYLVELDDSDYPLNGEAFFEYDLLMSRVDLLREGAVASLIRNFEGGRTTRLLNIINGELELLSFNLSKLESGDQSYLPDSIDRIKHVESQINEFVTLVNKGSNEYISNQHQSLQENLRNIQLLSIALLVCLLFFCFFAFNGIADLRRAFKRNEELSNSIKTAYDDKSHMLSFIAQEIRSPLNAILGTTKTLNTTESKTDIEALSKHIEESGNQLLQTIEMLSDLSLIDADKLTLIPTTQHLQSNIHDYIALFESQMARKNLQSIVYIDPLLPDYINIDFTRLKEIIIALIQNAITHTSSGSISLQIRPSSLIALPEPLPSDIKSARMLQIAVKDTGIGMSSTLQKHLRINPSLPSQQEGPLPSKVGLSLALCHKLVYLMQGEMHFSCASDTGCEFWVDIPFYIPITDSLEENNTFLCPDGTQALIIETDAQLANIISLQLAALNIKATISKEGSFFSNKDYDLVILGNTSRFEREGHDAIIQWQAKFCPILGYHAEAVDKPTYKIIKLTFPLTQNQLSHHIKTLFTEQKASSLKVNNND
ncbi:histidine kinase [Marinomonas sp. CT5]|uniref:sensor histidine kinase n=1 Tax=Marinomonas sp. CT5 TaxID=2066133 RepID=UPI001BAFA6FD|nr:ATP-binding protein [Marinomonas sp. CT5]QUX97917.1 histidine kinase [Marinomonas sp. CT5]